METEKRVNYSQKTPSQVDFIVHFLSGKNGWKKETFPICFVPYV